MIQPISVPTYFANPTTSPLNELSDAAGLVAKLSGEVSELAAKLCGPTAAEFLPGMPDKNSDGGGFIGEIRWMAKNIKVDVEAAMKAIARIDGALGET